VAVVGIGLVDRLDLVLVGDNVVVVAVGLGGRHDFAVVGLVARGFAVAVTGLEVRHDSAAVGLVARGFAVAEAGPGDRHGFAAVAEAGPEVHLDFAAGPGDHHGFEPEMDLVVRPVAVASMVDCWQSLMDPTPMMAVVVVVVAAALVADWQRLAELGLELKPRPQLHFRLFF
jgi:hypothetical protein